MAENFPNQKNETDNQIQETERAPNKMNSNRSTPRHTLIKIAKFKDKETILKAARENQRVIYKGIFIWPQADFSARTLQVRGVKHDIFKVLKWEKQTNKQKNTHKKNSNQNVMPSKIVI